MDMPAPFSAPTPPFQLTPITDGVKAGGGKKRQRPQSMGGGPSVPDRDQGLRDFSLKVCTVVQSRRETTYTDVADDVVKDVLGHQRTDDDDGRNIRRYMHLLLAPPRPICMPALLPSSDSDRSRRARRRVYDALNVLEAVDVISKDKKSVAWRGLPEGPGSQHFLQHSLDNARQSVAEKELMLRGLLGRFVAAKQLFERNRRRAADDADGTPPACAPPSTPAFPPSTSFPPHAPAATESSAATESPAATKTSAAPPNAPSSARSSPDELKAAAVLDTALTAGRAAAPTGASAAAAAGGSISETVGTSEAPTPAANHSDGSAGAGGHTGGGLGGESPVSPIVDIVTIAARLRAQRIALPFQLVATSTPSRVECSLTPDHREANLCASAALDPTSPCRPPPRRRLRLLSASRCSPVCVCVRVVGPLSFGLSSV